MIEIVQFLETRKEESHKMVKCMASSTPGGQSVRDSSTFCSCSSEFLLKVISMLGLTGFEEVGEHTRALLATEDDEETDYEEYTKKWYAFNQAAHK